MKYLIIGIILAYIIAFISEKIICKTNKLVLFIGLPGSGKSTIASAIVQKDFKLKKKEHTLVNTFIENGEELEEGELGKYKIENSTLVIDEAGMTYDNRQWKNNLDKDNIYFYKYHRHYNNDIYLFSQTFDIDCKILNLVNEIRVVKHSLIPFFIKTKEIRKKIDVNKETGEIINRYSWVPLSTKRYFIPKQWKYFNSYTRKELPIKEFKKYKKEKEEEIECLN